MIDNDKLIREIQDQEQQFHFSELTNQTALIIRIKNRIVIENNYPIAIHIMLASQRLFYYAHPLTVNIG